MTVELSILFVIQIHTVGIPNPSLFVERSWLPVSRAASVSGSLTNNAMRKRSREWSPCLGHTPKRSSRVKDWWILNRTLACSETFPLMNRGHRVFHQCTQWNMVRYIAHPTHSGKWSATSCIPLVHTVERGQLLRAVHQCTQWNMSATLCCPPVHTVERVSYFVLSTSAHSGTWSATSCCPPVHTVEHVSYIVHSTSAHSGTWSATLCCPPVHTVERVSYFVLSTSAHSGTWSATSCCPPVHTVERVSHFVLSTSAHSGTGSATSCCPPVHTVERVSSKGCRQKRKRTSVQAYKRSPVYKPLLLPDIQYALVVFEKISQYQ